MDRLETGIAYNEIYAIRRLISAIKELSSIRLDKKQSEETRLIIVIYTCRSIEMLICRDLEGARFYCMQALGELLALDERNDASVDAMCDAAEIMLTAVF